MIKTISALLFGIFILLPGVIHAQEAPSPAIGGLAFTLENLTQSLEMLGALKTSKRPIDVNTVQTAINNVITLSVVEIEDLQTKLNALKNLSESQREIREDYVQQLSTFRLYYEDARTELNQELSFNQTTAIGAALKEYRAETQETTGRIIDFIAVFQTQNAVSIAEGRLANIIKDKDKIRAVLSRAKWNSFLQLLKRAQSSIAHASQLSARAQELLSETTDERATGDTIDSLVVAASKNIQEAYTGFLAMSKLINNKK